MEHSFAISMFNVCVCVCVHACVHVWIDGCVGGLMGEFGCPALQKFE